MARATRFANLIRVLAICFERIFVKIAAMIVAGLVLAMPAIAGARTPDANSGAALSGATLQSEGASAPIVIARDDRRPPRRGEARRPPPRARTFVYRGRRADMIRGPRFVYPRGFAYRRWRIGQRFPAPLIAAPYFFAGFQGLGLQLPPPGYRWVRYGPDIVLVNVRTREIEDVAYGAIDDRY
jgi:Ni/Co efflux regulator RcnB